MSGPGSRSALLITSARHEGDRQAAADWRRLHGRRDAEALREEASAKDGPRHRAMPMLRRLLLGLG